MLNARCSLFAVEALIDSSLRYSNRSACLTLKPVPPVSLQIRSPRWILPSVRSNPEVDAPRTSMPVKRTVPPGADPETPLDSGDTTLMFSKPTDSTSEYSMPWLLGAQPPERPAFVTVPPSKRTFEGTLVL